MMFLKRVELNSWLQIIAIIVSIVVVGWQILIDLQSRRVESTLSFVINSSLEYRTLDHKHSIKSNGRLLPINREQVAKIVCTDDQSHIEIKNMFAVFEWLSVGVRKGGLDWDTVLSMRGSYYTDFYERWYLYLQASLDVASSQSRRERVYDQFEWLVQSISEERGYDFTPLNRRPLDKPRRICEEGL